MVTVKELYKNIDTYSNTEISIEGWIKTIRDSKTFGFIELNDGRVAKTIAEEAGNKEDK